MVRYFRRCNDKLNDIAISPSFLTAVSTENDVFLNVALCWLTNSYHSYRRCGGCTLLRIVGNFHQQTRWNMHLHVSFCYLWFKVHLIMTVSVREYKLCKAWKLLPFGTWWLVIWWIGNVSEEPAAFSFSVSGVSSRHLRNFCTNGEKLHDVFVTKTFRTANLKFLKPDFFSTAKSRYHYFG